MNVPDWMSFFSQVILIFCYTKNNMKIEFSKSSCWVHLKMLRF